MPCHIPSLKIILAIAYRKGYIASMAKDQAAVDPWGSEGGKRRWKGKTKAQKRAHMKMMSDKATAARKKKAQSKPLDT